MPLPLASLCILLLLSGTAVSAQDSPPGLALQSDVDHVWTAVAAALVFFMQAGFLLLEAGSVRSKNSVNVAQKNLMDFIISTVMFGAFGYMLMFGTSWNGVIGWDRTLLFFGSAGDWSLTFFVFQLMFCGTAATIMSGAVAERMTMNGYLLSSVLIAVVIYPVAGHWTWGGLLNGSDEPMLASMGFMDFAGSTVVHSVGAWVALAAIVIIGPRIGKFDENGNPRALHGHSPVLATVGAIILWVGWIGFNGGSVLSGTSDFAPVIVNTMVAGGAGGASLMLLGRVTSGLFHPHSTINGLLGGLVAITAGADVMTPQTSFAIGALGGVVVFLSTHFLERVLKLDDPLGAIPVHGFAGAFGTIAIAFFAPEDSLLAGSRLDQLLAQLTGVGVVFAWAFGLALLVLKAVDLALKSAPDDGGGGGLRVSELHEREGLNLHEHNAPMGTGILQEVMAELARNHSGSLEPIEIEYGDEAYETSVLFNRIIANIGAERAEEESRYQADKAKRLAVEAEISEVVHACATGDFSKRLSTEGRKDFLLELCHGINALTDSTEGAMRSVQASLEAVAAGDLTRTMDGAYEGQVRDIQTAMNGTLGQLAEIVGEVQQAVSAAGRGDFGQLILLDAKSGFFRGLCEGVNALCEISEKGLSELFETLNRIGDGDLTVRMSDDYQGRFAQIGDAVARMTAGIGELLGSIEETALSVSATGIEIAKTSDQVASGSVQQSQRIEATATTLRELAETARETAHEAQTADALCRKAFDRAEDGREVSGQLLTQIADIQEATNQITEALERIESISMQTTLLSLNASVEAVRGGQRNNSNAGFKVVAEEIRALATRSSSAAEDIRGRTERVRASVARGANLVEQATGLLSDINAAMSESSECVGRLVAAGGRQLTRSEEIAHEVTGISANAAENRGLAEQSAETSRSLDSRAAETIARVAQFKRPGGRGKLAA